MASTRSSLPPPSLSRFTKPEASSPSLGGFNYAGLAVQAGGVTGHWQLHSISIPPEVGPKVHSSSLASVLLVITPHADAVSGGKATLLAY